MKIHGRVRGLIMRGEFWSVAVDTGLTATHIKLRQKEHDMLRSGTGVDVGL